MKNPDHCFAPTCIAFAAILLTACQSRVPDNVTAPELRDHATFLASDQLAGRRVGEPGIAVAEQHIYEQFAAAGLEPLPGEPDYFLEFSLYAYAFGRQTTQLIVETDEGTRTFDPGADLRPFGFSGTGVAEDQVVFAGYGITAPEFGYDDYAGLDVNGKVVLVMRHEPEETEPDSLFDGTRHSKHAYFEEKMKNAMRHGATAMLLYTDPLHHDADEDLRLTEFFSFDGSRTISDDDDADSIPSVHVSREIARTLLNVDETALRAIQRRVDRGTTPSELAPDVREARLTVSRSIEPREVIARNVAGFVPGNSDRWIIVGAHHDHVGAYAGDGDTIYNGADDNVSGTSLLLELAEYFGTDSRRRDRNIAFITFSAEEVGLFGSRATLAEEWFPESDIEIMINLDMIGRNPEDPMIVYGDGFSEGLTEILQSTAENSSLELALQGRKYDPASDHHPFRERNIPFLMFHTGEHPDYHGVGDHAEKLEYGRMAQLGHLLIDLIDEISVRGVVWKNVQGARP